VQHAPFHPPEEKNAILLYWEKATKFLLGKYSIHFFKLIILSVSFLEKHGKKKGTPLSKVLKCFVKGKVGSHVSKYSFLRGKV